MITKYQANKELGYNLGKRTYTPPSTLYICISTSHVNSDGGNATEPISSSGYARVAITNDASSFSVPTNGKTKTLKKLEFPEFKIDAGTALDVFIADAITGGNILYYDVLEKSRILQADSTLYFEAGGLEFIVANEA